MHIFWWGLSPREFLCHEDKTRTGLGNGSHCLKATKYVLLVRTSQSLLTDVNNEYVYINGTLTVCKPLRRTGGQLCVDGRNRGMVTIQVDAIWALHCTLLHVNLRLQLVHYAKSKYLFY
jgi:hypothetical protein